MPDERDRRAQITIDDLHLILLPTEQCNFRCAYCFEDFALGRMSSAIVSGLKRLLTARAPGVEQLTLHWYGGEPLLARDIIEEVQAHALELLRLHPRIRFHGAVTTNGYLLQPETLARLVRLGVEHYQVTFDGPREQHDQKRVLAGGQGTFQRIWDNLLQARSVEDAFDVVVRVHVNRDNRESVPRFLESFHEAFGGDNRFVVFLRPVAHLGGRGNSCTDVLPESEAREAMTELRAHANRIGVSQFEGTPGSICYAAHPAVWVVRADGSLSKCTVALSHPANRVGCLNEDGTLTIDAERFRPWMEGLVTGELSALECPAREFVHANGG
jgi:uncharacterized protein